MVHSGEGRTTEIPHLNFAQAGSGFPMAIASKLGCTVILSGTSVENFRLGEA